MIYFKRQEFDSPDIKESGALMDADFLKKLNLARHKAAIPFKINSGYRTKAHNKKVGGKRENWKNPTLPATIIQIEAIENIAEKLLERKARRIKTENPCHLSR